MADTVEGEIVNRRGRPTKHDETVVEKFEVAFHNGFNITEACQYAEIDRSTYYLWLADDDVFSYRMSVAQAAPTKAAKSLIISAIQKGDANLAFRYLERRDPDFKPKAEVTNTPEMIETREKIREFLDDTNDDPGSEPAATASTETRGEVAQAPTDIS